MRHIVLFMFCLFLAASSVEAQTVSCQFYNKSPNRIVIDQGQQLTREVEIDFTNTGSNTWQRTGGVSNLQYIELRPVSSNGLSNIESPIYHSSWINRKRVGSFLAIQNGVAPGQTARFVFQVSIDARSLSVGNYNYFFRPYHAQAGYIDTWSSTSIEVVVRQPPVNTPQPRPTASIDGVHPSTTVVDGTQVTLFGSLTASTQAEWSDSSGQVLATTNIFSNFFPVGSHTIRFRSIGVSGVSDYDYITITVIEPNPVASIDSVSHANPVLHGTTITFTGSATNHANQYEWLQDGAVVGTSLVLEKTFTQSGSYYMTFRARNSSGWSNNARHYLYIAEGPQSAPPNYTPPSAPNPPTNPGNATVAAHILSATFTRSVLDSSVGHAASTENYDLVSRGVIPIRKFHQLFLIGEVSGQVAAYEWSVLRGSQVKVIGTDLSLTTKPTDLEVGASTIRFRAQSTDGTWSAYDELDVSVESWPFLKLPVHGRWKRSGNDYNEGDHLGLSASGAQDWNQADGLVSDDFGREIVASLGGVAATGISTLGGNYVSVVSDTPSGEFRSLFFHLSTVLVQGGDQVLQGQPIGLCGNTGTSSSASHLHYVFQKKINGVWVSQIPEPVWITDTQVAQVIPYGQIVESSNRSLPTGMLVLDEPVVPGAQSDKWGWGASKQWVHTTSGVATAFADWNITIPQEGTWRLFMHSPSGYTQNSAGIPSHNTSTRAHFRIFVNGSSIPVQRYIAQSGSNGALVLIDELDLHAQDHVLITQDNATGGDGAEMSFDQLLFKRISSIDGGGATAPPSDQTSSANSSDAHTGAEEAVHTSSVPRYIDKYGRPASGGGGGCSVSPSPDASAGVTYFVSVLMLYLLAIVKIRPRAGR